MTRPDNPNSHNARTGNADQWRSRWLVPLVPVVLGAVILVAAAINGHIVSGMAWFVVLSAISALSRVAGRFDAARRGHRHGEDEREASEDEREAIINTRAMSITGTVLVIALTGCAAFTLARGESTNPYTALLAAAGIAYTITFLALRYRHS